MWTLGSYISNADVVGAGYARIGPSMRIVVEVDDRVVWVKTNPLSSTLS